MPGIKPKGKVKIEWSADFAYAIGLIVSDGCVANNGRHIFFTSKDLEQIENFKRCLRIECPITPVFSGYKDKMALRVQFGDRLFCDFLRSIGITDAKSLTIGELKIPDEFFFDFLRGEFDGDGCTYSYWDKRWKSSFMFYLSFTSGSMDFLEWLRSEISKRTNCAGHISSHKKLGGKNPFHQLRFAKKQSLKIIGKMYYNNCTMFLSRKRLKINKALGIIGISQL